MSFKQNKLPVRWRLPCRTQIARQLFLLATTNSANCRTRSLSGLCGPRLYLCTYPLLRSLKESKPIESSLPALFNTLPPSSSKSSHLYLPSRPDTTCQCCSPRPNPGCCTSKEITPSSGTLQLTPPSPVKSTSKRLSALTRTSSWSCPNTITCG